MIYRAFVAVLKLQFSIFLLRRSKLFIKRLIFPITNSFRITFRYSFSKYGCCNSMNIRQAFFKGFVKVLMLIRIWLVRKRDANFILAGWFVD